MPETAVSALACRARVLAAVAPFVTRAAEILPQMSTPDVAVSIIVQRDPLVARLLIEGPQTACEGMRLIGSAIPGHAELGEATEEFFAAGLSALPESVLDGLMGHAEKPGAGLFAWVRPNGDVGCFLAPSRCTLDLARRIFSIESDDASEEPARPVTIH